MAGLVQRYLTPCPGEACLLAASSKCDWSVKSKTFLRELKNRLSVM